MAVNSKNWQELKKPTHLEVKDSAARGRKVTFVAEPLERGFGLTLGNALRRVLLSSLLLFLSAPALSFDRGRVA